MRGKNKIMDELVKLGSSRAMVSLVVFIQELDEPSITKALAKASKATESSQAESISESPEVMEIHSD
jgi:hypothetical protein